MTTDATSPGSHVVIEARILYFGTPVAFVDERERERHLQPGPDVVGVGHADQRVVVPGTNHVAPALWSPLIYNFRHYFSLGAQHGHSFRPETAAQHP